MPGSGGQAAAGASTTTEVTASQLSGGDSNQMEATSAAKRTRDEAGTVGSDKDADAERDRKPLEETEGDGPRDGR